MRNNDGLLQKAQTKKTHSEKGMSNHQDHENDPADGTVSYS